MGGAGGGGKIMNESDIQRLIEKRYAPPAWAALTHVRNQTGFSRATRTADAMAMSLYPSRGLDLIGLEIKCDRGDWVREMKDPAKAEEFVQFCDRWFLVVADESIVQTGELPTTWGLLVAQKARLVCKVEAPKLTPKPIERHLLAGLLRNVTERYVPYASLVDRVEGARSAGYEEGKRDGERDAGRAPAELRRLEERVAAFERESGLSLDKWGSGEVGKRVRLLEHIEFASFGSIADQAEVIAKLAREAETEAKAKVEAARVNAVA
jgi:hypothetical protein